jgi:hypothetical protein
MFPFNSYEAAKLLVDDHIADLRRSGQGPRTTRRGRRRAGRSGADSRS